MRANATRVVDVNAKCLKISIKSSEKQKTTKIKRKASTSYEFASLRQESR